MKLGIFAKTFAGTTPLSVLSGARDAGYVTVQYNMACSGLGSLPLHISELHAEAVSAASRETGVEIAAVSATYNVIHPDPNERERGRQSFKAIASAAPRIGTRLLTMCTGTCDRYDLWRYHPDNSSPAAWDELLRELRYLLSVAEEYDVELGIEPELANVVNSAQRARQLLDAFSSDRIRIVFDGANLFEIATVEEQRLLVSDAVDLLGDSIALAHAKDRSADGRFVAAGNGVLDYRHYLTALQDAGYQGPLITHGLQAEQAVGVYSFLKTTVTAVNQDQNKDV